MRTLSCAIAAAAGPGFQPLFDGKTLDGCKLVDPRGSGCIAEDGVVVRPEGGGGKPVTLAGSGDFVLRMEYRIGPAGNNGVNIRAPYEERPAYAGMEIQILDDSGEKWKAVKSEQRTGPVCGVIPARTGFAKPPGQWNQMEITAQGRRATVVLNGTILTDVDLDIVREPDILGKHPGLGRSSGYLGLPGHTTRTEFRNLRVRRL
jgi:hypothetical protein